jgi:hypothetical protein
MNFTFVGLSAEETAAIQAEFQSSQTPLTTKSDLTIHPQDGFLLFEFEDGLSYYRAKEGETPVETFRSYLSDVAIPRYLPMTYEIDSDPSVSEKVLTQYQEKYGSASEHVDWMITEWKDKTILMVLIPQEIVTQMMREQGGTLVSFIRGPAESLRQIPTMKSLIQDSVSDSEVIKRIFATQYQRSQYADALEFHWKLVNEVVKSPASGISLGPFGKWYP